MISNTIPETSGSSASATESPPAPSVWGLDATTLNDRFWAARGVQVVRQGEPSQIVEDAELFLLTASRTLTIFKLNTLVDMLSWLKPELLYVRLHDEREHGYREIALTDAENRFVRFDRIYGGLNARLARVAITPEREIAQAWQRASDVRAAWTLLRKRLPRTARACVSSKGHVYDRSVPQEMTQFARDLVRLWKEPEATISRVRRVGPRAWADKDAQYDKDTRFVGPVWIGAGAHDIPDKSVIGPAVLWDAPGARPETDAVRWQEIEPSESFTRTPAPRERTSFSAAAKRVFDFVFAVIALLLTLPLYPLVMAAIYIEDGRPFFFAHQRETKGGAIFPCIKFRSMRRNAEKLKAELAAENQADGPQFYIDKDPRITRVGAVLRKLYIDELPQFINVLLGQMSVVGPRPSPRRENQYCPPWREARLSVRPGVTGLWQVSRTRHMGEDFQEWIKYDIKYVENAGWMLDMYVIARTFTTIVRGIFHS